MFRASKLTCKQRSLHAIAVRRTLSSGHLREVDTIFRDLRGSYRVQFGKSSRGFICWRLVPLQANAGWALLSRRVVVEPTQRRVRVRAHAPTRGHDHAGLGRAGGRHDAPGGCTWARRTGQGAARAPGCPRHPGASFSTLVGRPRRWRHRLRERWHHITCSHHIARDADTVQQLATGLRALAAAQGRGSPCSGSSFASRRIRRIRAGAKLRAIQGVGPESALTGASAALPEAAADALHAPL